MSTYQVTAIIRSELLETVASCLQQIDVCGVTISTVKGYGEFANPVSHDWTTQHARLEIFVGQENVESIVEAIRGGACTDAPGDGIIAVTPVERMIRIRTGEAPDPEQLVRGAPPIRADEPPRVPVLGVALAVLTAIIVLCGFFAPIEHRLHLLSLALLLTLLLTVVVGAYRAVSRRGMHDDMVAKGGAPVDHMANNKGGVESREAPS